MTRWLALLPVVLAGACRTEVVQTTAPAARTIEDLERVFAPMQERLSVAADTLRIDVSAELWDRFANPARSEKHELRFDPGPPSTYRFHNKTGGLSLPLKFVIGNQTYLIIRAAILRVHRTGPARFDLRAEGSVVVNRPGRPSPAEVPVLRVSNGKWEERL